ncbi:hypothetical protein EJM73_08815 [Clostridium botulinum]|uniref:hypothetical protein n=1 Tax=Clostridium botulinum TaxID=1491 RepID=UPI0013762984|nr:hypothetical protein [Clostridium botulinum]NCI19725.1 hypothetical protein [Clostridium botulinum]NCI35763.1 hypothetical protein [Clostridium botulinum]NCI71620.1 hypothetical protein [Clostridium botulinum]NDI38812.1 hypothetical protein [Clostridium botulinum]HCL4447182.1 hypothetical protein [Clostridium botulinum]
MINVDLRDSQKLKEEDKSLFVSFDYNPEIVRKVKAIDTRAYHFETKEWELSQEGIHKLIEIFGKDRLNIDENIDLDYVKKEVCLNNKCKWSIFNPLLKTMPEDIQKFTIEILEQVPNYFYSEPASTSGLHHPSYALGQGGLLRHTLSAGLIALELFRNNTVCIDFNNREKHLMLSAIILHDTFKQGLEGGKYVTDHPIIASSFISQFNQDILPIEEVGIICNCISTHMGEWTYDYKLKRNVLSKPQTEMQKFVHLCDYLSSRRLLEVNFDIVK